MHQGGSVARRRRVEPNVMSGIGLTPAEVRTLELLPTHLTVAQIAAELFISRNTAKSHVASIYRKLLARSRADAVRRARAGGLLPAPPDGRAAPAGGDHQARVLAFPASAALEESEPDIALVVARSWAAREQAREVRARAHRAREAWFSLLAACHQSHLQAQRSSADQNYAGRSAR